MLPNIYYLLLCKCLRAVQQTLVNMGTFPISTIHTIWRERGRRVNSARHTPRLTDDLGGCSRQTGGSRHWRTYSAILSNSDVCMCEYFSSTYLLNFLEQCNYVWQRKRILKTKCFRQWYWLVPWLQTAVTFPQHAQWPVFRELNTVVGLVIPACIMT